MSGKVDVQSNARRSYSAVVIPTDALFTFGILKLTSLIVAAIGSSQENYTKRGVLISRYATCVLMLKIADSVKRRGFVFGTGESRGRPLLPE